MAGAPGVGSPDAAPSEEGTALRPVPLNPSDDPQVWVVNNGDLRLAFLPAVGGRLLSLQTAGREWLWVNPDYFSPDLSVRRPRDTWTVLDGTMASWANVGGSKTWPAPQGWDGPGQWAGPPDAVLDAGEFALEWAPLGDGGVEIVLISPDDPRSGLRIERRFAIPQSGTTFTETATFTNIARSPITWSIWEVCQVDTAAGAGLRVDQACVEVGVDEAATAVVLASAVGEVEVGPARPGVGGGLVRRVPIRDVVAKVGLPDADRFVAYVAPGGDRLEIGFDAVPAARYPDGGSRVEIWMQFPLTEPLPQFEGLHPSAYLAELEVLSPAARLLPGASTSLNLRWSVGP